MNQTAERRLLWLMLGPLALVSLALAGAIVSVAVGDPTLWLPEAATGVVVLVLFSAGVAVIAAKAVRPRVWLWAVGPSLILGLVLAALAMTAAWGHNPQGAFHEGTQVRWWRWLMVGALWFLVASAPSIAVLRVALAIIWRPAGPPPNNALSPPRSAVTARANSGKRRASRPPAERER